MTENLFRGKRMNLRTLGDAFSTAPCIVKYNDMNRERFIDRLTEVQQIVEQAAGPASVERA